MSGAARLLWSYGNTAGWYLGVVRRAREILASGRRVRLGWAGEDLDAAGWQREFRQALDRRINLKAGPAPTGRKHGYLYQLGLMRDRQRLLDIRQLRLRVYQFETPEIRARFGHLLSSHED